MCIRDSVYIAHIGVPAPAAHPLDEQVCALLRPVAAGGQNGQRPVSYTHLDVYKRQVLGNPMASPATLGVSNAAVFGANLSILALSGGFLSTGNNLTSYTAGADPFATSALAFVCAAGSVLVVLALCRLRDFSPNVVVLAGIALGSVWTAATTKMCIRDSCGRWHRTRVCCCWTSRRRA